MVNRKRLGGTALVVGITFISWNIVSGGLCVAIRPVTEHCLPFSARGRDRLGRLAIGMPGKP